MVVILIRREDAKYFCPNFKKDLEFGNAFYTAIEAGVDIRVYISAVTCNSLSIKKQIPIPDKKTAILKME